VDAEGRGRVPGGVARAQIAARQHREGEERREEEERDHDAAPGGCGARAKVREPRPPP
jgi:hypothetical protein